MVPLLSINPLVAYDVDRFRRLIASKGGTLGDGVISEREAVARLTDFVTLLYAIVGRRVDFWPLQEAYQVGFGSKAYWFHGLEGTLVNGPTWHRGGVRTDSSMSQYGKAVIDPIANFTLLSVMRRLGDSTSTPWYFGLGDASNDSNYLYYLGEGGVGYFGDGPSGAFTPQRTSANNTTDFAWQSFRYTSLSATSSVNGVYTDLASVAVLDPVNVFAFGGRVFDMPTGASSNTENAFYCIAPPLDNTSVDAIRSAYKSTLGQELGLP